MPHITLPLRPRVVRRGLALIAFGTILAGTGVGYANRAWAACEVSTTITYKAQRDWGYWLSTGVTVVLAVAALTLVVLLASRVRRSR